MKIMKSVFRELAWRTGRRLYCWARGDLTNDPEVNGEYWLLERVLASCEDGATLMDVGANQGNWSVKALELASAHQKNVALYAFEPSSITRAMLCDRLGKNQQAEVCGFALTSHEGEGEFFSNAAGSGTNSLHPVSGTQTETVALTTVDAFVAKRGIRHVTMIKIDTEGFDFQVLKGAIQLLESGSVDLVQFEYNWRWLLNGASLHNVFRLIEKSALRFGKLVGESIEFFDEWHFELDRYFENNYVLVRRASAYNSLGKSMEFDASNVAVAIAQP